MFELIFASLLLAAWLFGFGFVGWACGRSRKRENAGFWLGVLLGPLGCVVALFLPLPVDGENYDTRGDRR